MVKELAAFRDWGAEQPALQGDMWSERRGSNYTLCDPRAGLKPIHTLHEVSPQLTRAEERA